jgi:hypothetical protein
MFMRTLLRNGPTGLYVRAVDSWTFDPKEAFDFKTMREAIGFAEATHFTSMEVVFAGDDRRSVTAISLTALRASVSFRNRPGPSTQLGAAGIGLRG